MPNATGTEQREKEIDALCSRHTLDALRAVVGSTTTAAVIVALVLSAEVEWPRLAVWLTGVTFIAAARYVIWRNFHSRPRSDAELRSFLLPTFSVALFAAVWWGTGLPIVAHFSSSLLVTTTVLLAVIAMMTGGAGSLAGSPRITMAVYATSVVTPLGQLLLSTDTPRRVLALMVGGLFFASIGALRQNNRSLRDAFRLRLENEDLLAEAERANQDKSRFLAAASHDARQPLHALGLFVDTLKEQTLEPRSRQLVDNIDLAHGSLVSLHEGLLELSVADSGAVVPRLRPVALAQLLRTVETESAPRARQRGLSLELAGPALVVLSDPDLLLRVMRNLVANALAYTEHGRVLITVRRRAGHALLQVWDTGIGIAAEEQPRIFDELYQVGNASRDRRAGLGLGLAIVRRLAGALGTDVTVRSKLGKGSVFSLTQPLTTAALAVEPPSQAPTAREQTVLLVDDDGLTRSALGVMLEGWGFEVVVAQSAEEALDYASQLERLDALVTDLWLPGRSGLSLLEEFRSARPHVRRIVISADTAPDVPARVRALDAAFLRKPVRSAALKEVLSSLTSAGASALP